MTANLTVFLVDRSRGGAALEALLGEQFAGIVGSDRWSVYSQFLAERRALCYANLKRDFQAVVDRGGDAESIGRWGLAEIERVFVLWHRFRVEEFDRKALRRRLVPIQARQGRLIWRGEATINVAERALRAAVLWRKGSFGSDSIAGSRFAERMLTVAATCRQQSRHLPDVLIAAGKAALEGRQRLHYPQRGCSPDYARGS